MPSGYTAPIIEGGGVSFEEFVWGCARAFGALVMMREMGPGAKIPERFEPTDYHVKRRAEAEERYRAAEVMTNDQAEERAAAEYERAVAYYDKSQAEDAERLRRYEAMLTRVRDWTPPTPDHIEMKSFMVKQIEESIRFDCGYERTAPVRLTGAAWRAQEMAAAARDIAYHAEKHRKEIEADHWLAALRESVPMPEKLKAGVRS